jgi:hypothetical protein
MMPVNTNGVRYDARAYADAHERMRSAPLTLTADDLEQMAAVSPALVDQAHQLQKMAQHHPTVSTGTTTRTKTMSTPEAMAAESVKFIKCALAPVLARLAEAEQEIKDLKQALDAQPAVKYCGTWRVGQAYSEGNFVTKHGGLWCAIRSRPDVPGTSGSGWQLAVKSGTAVRTDHPDEALPVVRVQPPRSALPVVHVGARR